MNRIAFIAGAFGAFFAGPAAAETLYTLNVTFTETDGEAQRVRSVEEVVEIVDGPIDIGDSDAAGSVAVKGDLTVDEAARTARATLKVCRPGMLACRPMIKPDLSFAIGEPASFYVAGPTFSISVKLAPSTQ